MLHSEHKTDGVLLVGHNIWASDCLVLNAQCQRLQLHLGPLLSDSGVIGYTDTLSMAKTIFPDRKGQGVLSLDAISQLLLHETIDGYHDAFVDAKANAQILQSAQYLQYIQQEDVRIARRAEPMTRHMMILYEAYLHRQETESSKMKKSRKRKLHADDASDDGNSQSDTDDSEEEEAASDDKWEDVTDRIEDDNIPARDWKPVLGFTPRKTGPRGIQRDATRKQIFLKLFPRRLIMKAVRFTNLYASQTRRIGWYDTTELEVLAFIGCLLFMGAKGIGRNDAWEPYPIGDEYMKGVFTHRRFQDLWACIHFVDNNAVPESEKKADSFWRLRPVIDTLNDTSKEFYVPTQHLSLDEMTTPFKGHVLVDNLRVVRGSMDNQWTVAFAGT